MKCFVYRNLHKPNHTYSIKALEGEHKGRVIGYASSITIEEAPFVVREAGRQRVLETGHKNVHAGIIGTFTSARDYEERLTTPPHFNEKDYDISSSRPNVIVTYNPYVAPTFFNVKTKEPVHGAGLVCLWGALIEAYDLVSSDC